MTVKIALAGNPNSGKTTLFNALTGSNQYVGNWPGVTVEKKEGRLKGGSAVLVDLPGIYSLSPYTLEEVVSRNFLLDEKPDAIINIIDGSNLERNLYLTTQLLELGIPTIVAVNMMDIVRKNGDTLTASKLGEALGCEVVEISALKNDGISALAEKAVKLAGEKKTSAPAHKFDQGLEDVLRRIEEGLPASLPEAQRRFYAIKVFEHDSKVLEAHKDFNNEEALIAEYENEADDDSESIITNARYTYISSIIGGCFKRMKSKSATMTDKIDRIVTHRVLALPIFAAIMFLVYYISVTSVGTILTDWANDGVFGDGWHLFGIGAGEFEEAFEGYEEAAAGFEEVYTGAEEDFDDALALFAEEPDPAEYGVWVPGIPVLLEGALEAVGCADWLMSLILDGIVGGVGAVLGFVPQMLVLFLLLAFLEACGYMARIAFIMDRIFRKFGLSGKSFIPMLIGTGCGVPGVMASRTIENQRDRRMTIMTTTFIPCGAKLPIIALIAGALFDDAWWVAASAYFIGIGAIIISGIMLKKTRMFAGDPAPFVMELPAYHMPTAGGVLRSMWERGWSFIKKAGTIVLLSTIFIWFTSSFGMVDGVFGMVDEMSDSILAVIGSGIAWLFVPLGWGDWQAAVATFTGLIAKENVVGTFGVLYGFAEVGEAGEEIWGMLAASFTSVAAYSFLVFNLLCAPCFAAIGAIRREMNSAKWTWFAIGYQTCFAYAISLCVYQFGTLFTTGAFGLWTVVAVAIVGLLCFLLLRPEKPSHKIRAVN